MNDVALIKEDIEKMRQRLGNMSDAELEKFSKDAKFMCSSGANSGSPPRDIFFIQLREARIEERRRQSK